MQIKYCCTNWGSDYDKPAVFVDKVLLAGYEGIEINFPSLSDAPTKLYLKLIADALNTNPDFTFIAQHILPVQNISVDAYICNYVFDLRIGHHSPYEKECRPEGKESCQYERIRAPLSVMLSAVVTCATPPPLAKRANTEVQSISRIV